MSEYVDKVLQRSLYTAKELVDRALISTKISKPSDINFNRWKGDPNTLTGLDRPRYAKWKLQRLGWKDYQAAAMVGNLMQESFTSLRTDIWGDAGTAFGIAQWRLDRLVKLKIMAERRNTPINDLDLQLDFLNGELLSSEKFTGELLKKSQGIESAVRAAVGFFRPRGYSRDNPEKSHGYSKRLAYAQSLMDM